MQRRDFLLTLGSSAVLLAEPASAIGRRRTSGDAWSPNWRARSRGETLSTAVRSPALEPRRRSITTPTAKIRFNPDRALWADQNSHFRAQYFHRGFLFKEAVELNEVAGRHIRPIAYSSGSVRLRRRRPKQVLPVRSRLCRLPHARPAQHAGLSRRDSWSSSARAISAGLGKNNVYGLSARGLAIGTWDSRGEEFPRFSKFWLERPKPDAKNFVIHALLEGPSIAGAYRFDVTPGDPTIMDVKAQLFPRNDVALGGVAPLTSMFLFSPADRRIDDFRQGVHDSDGLLIWNGGGEQIWRPLRNPSNVQESVFTDKSPRGFGLMQRARSLDDFEDYEANYEKRPGVWIEPDGDWGEGAVHLFETPAPTETIDNIVAFWRPAKAWRAGSAHKLAYRMYWGAAPAPATQAFTVAQTRTGRGGPVHAPNDASRMYAVTFAGSGDMNGLTADVTSNGGEIGGTLLTSAPGGVRVTFELTPGSAPVAEMRARLKRGDQVVSETWLNRWTV
jgi:glucans biosynthesis protein